MIDRLFFNVWFRGCLILLFLSNSILGLIASNYPSNVFFLYELVESYPIVALAMHLTFKAVICSVLLIYLLLFTKLEEFKKIPFVIVVVGLAFKFSSLDAGLYSTYMDGVLWNQVVINALALITFLFIEISGLKFNKPMGSDPNATKLSRLP